MGGFQDDYEDEDDFENGNDDEYVDYDEDYGDYNYMLSLRVRLTSHWLRNVLGKSCNYCCQ